MKRKGTRYRKSLRKPEPSLAGAKILKRKLRNGMLFKIDKEAKGCKKKAVQAHAMVFGKGLRMADAFRPSGYHIVWSERRASGTRRQLTKRSRFARSNSLGLRHNFCLSRFLHAPFGRAKTAPVKNRRLRSERLLPSF